MAHQKHSKLERTITGKYHKNEFSFIGAPCSLIQKLVIEISRNLIHLKSGYYDASHKENKQTHPNTSLKLVDNQNYVSIEDQSSLNDFDRKFIFANLDILLINGNHFDAQNQIVIIDPSKKDSLQRKINRLTNILAIIKIDNTPIYDFISPLISESTPVFFIEDTNGISQFLFEEYKQTIAPIYGLILTGGKSTRMGKDKSKLNFNGVAQAEHLYNLLSPFCEKTYYSVANHTSSFKPNITDKFENLGPTAGILSAFQKHPNAAWFVLATDLFLMDKSTIKKLIQQRNPSKIATSYIIEKESFPEPLITIWEPRAYPRLFNFLSLGFSCPRKVLINSDIHTVLIKNKASAKNFNTPEDLLSIDF